MSGWSGFDRGFGKDSSSSGGGGLSPELITLIVVVSFGLGLLVISMN